MVKLVADSGAALTLIRNGDLDISGLVGGWQQSERMLLEDADWWKSSPKGAISAPLMLDIDAVGGPSLERRLTVLYSMGQPVDEDDPPGLRLFGDVPAPLRQLTWKMDDVKLAAALYREEAISELRRLELTVELSTLAVATGVTGVTVKRTRDSKGKRRRRTISARKGDTLRAIAVRQLGSSGDYKKIRDWNPKLKHLDPDAPLRAGTKVVLH